METAANDVFWGRQEELALLRDWDGSRPRLTVVYGRRRVGKTRLVEEAYANGDLLKVEGLEGLGKTEQQSVFKQMLIQRLGYTEDIRRKRDWLDLFSLLSEAIGDRPVVVLLDEFQWLACGRKTMVSKLKHAWDNLFAKRNRVHLILCGSVSSFMVKKVLRSKALYGRVDCELDLRPLEATDVVHDFSRKRSLPDIVEIFMAVGGVPRYLKLFDLNTSVRINLEKLCFRANAFLLKEFERLFTSHFGSNPHYRDILLKLAKRKWLDLHSIKRDLRLESGGRVSTYLEELEMAGFVERYSSVAVPGAVRGSRYRLSDPYLDFFFKFIHPNMRRINERRAASPLAQYLPDKTYNPWKGIAFERFCHAHRQLIAHRLGFGRVAFDAGPWFLHGIKGRGFQADLVFRRDDRVLTVCEMKCLSRNVGLDIIPAFQRMLDRIDNPRQFTIEKILITTSEPTRDLLREGFFHQILTPDNLLL